MIYLIDDSDLKTFNAEYVLSEKYKDILTLITSCEQLDNIEDDLEDADCIMVHNTFNKSNLVREDMATITDDGDNIPFVVFSGGDSFTSYNIESSNVIDRISKTIFYQRLKYFLDYFVENNKVNLRILAEGKDYIKIDIKNHALNVFNLIKGKDGFISSEDLDALNKIPSMKAIIDISQPKIGITYDTLVKMIENKSLTYNALKNNINRILISFLQYGKNIYVWK